MKPPVPALSGKLCLVTGAASGIGRATAIASARAGARVVLTDVQADALESVTAEIGSAAVLSRALNIADYESVRQLAADVHEAHGSVDVAMNIAGIAIWGAVERLQHEQWRRVVDINLMGPIHVIESFVPEMIRAGRGGQLVNVSSAAGLLGFPWHAPYSATKFGLRGVSEVLRFDLKRHRIGVTLVCPGGVDTGLVKTVEVAGVDTQGARMTKLRKVFQRRAHSPEQAAKSILEGVTKNRYMVYTSRDVQFGYLAQRYIPFAYARAMQIANDQFVRAMEPR